MYRLAYKTEVWCVIVSKIEDIYSEIHNFFTNEINCIVNW